MKLQVLQEDLSKALNISLRFINTRSTLPILGNFLLKAEKTKLIIKATNLEMSISRSLGAKVEEEGEITVPAQTITQIISNITTGQLTLTLEKEQLKIESSDFVASVPTSPANDFPSIPDNINEKQKFTLASSSLSLALSKVLFSASSDESRPVLTGVLFTFKDDALRIVSSDGFRLSQKTIKLDKKIEAKNIIVPKNSLLELVKICKDEEKIEFELKATENQLIIKTGDTYLSTRLIEGNFPDFEKIIPKNPSTKVTLSKEDLERGVRLASVFAKEDSGVIKLVISENNLELTSESEKKGNQKNKIEAKVEGPNLDILYNFKFIEEFLSVVKADDLEIKLTDPVSPAIFVDPKDTDFLHLIMPVRIQN